MRASTSYFDAIAAFERELVRFGLELPPGGLVADGNIHTLDDSSHHRRRNGAGRYWLREMPSGLLIGWGHSWFNNRGSFNWNSRNETTFTEADRKAIAEQRRKVAADRDEQYRLGAERADAVWAAGKPCSSHPYLTTKNVQSYGLRVDAQGRLLIPLYDFDGNLHGVQRIDAKGKKLWVLGANRKLPTHFVIGQLEGAEVIEVVEGYATGATVHEGTGHPVVVAFDANGMTKVAKPLRAKYLRAHLVFAGDNDASETGQKAAEAAARAAGGVAVMPPITGTDWNDHAHGAIKDGVVVCEPHGVEDVGNRLLRYARIVELPETVTLKEGERRLEEHVSSFFSLAQRWADEKEARDIRDAASKNGALKDASKADADARTKANILAAVAQVKAEAANAKPTKRNKDLAASAAKKAAKAAGLAAETKRWLKAIEEEIAGVRADEVTGKKKPADRDLLDRMPQHLLNITMAAGKTRVTRNHAVSFLLDNETAVVGFSVPTHRLTSEQARDIKVEAGLDGAIWRGMERLDPERDDGKNMCLEPDLVEAAEEANVDQTTVCSACPSRDECGYRRQRTQYARAWFYPHNLLFSPRPTAIPKPDVLVIDEAFHDAAMVDGSRLAASTLLIDLPDIEDELDRALLEEANRRLFSALRAAGERATGEEKIARLTRADLVAADIDANAAKVARALAWTRSPKVKLSGSVANMVEELKALAGKFTPKVPILWRMVEDLLRGGHDIATGIEVEPNGKLKGGDGFGLVVHMSYRREIHESWHAPTLATDGTAQPEIVRRWLPDLLVLPPIHIEAPHQRNIWVRASFSKRRLTQADLKKAKKPEGEKRYNVSRARNLEDLRRYIEVQAARYRGQAVEGPDVLVVVNEAVEIELKNGALPANAVIGHFNALRWSNAFEKVRAVIVVGRTLPADWKIRRQAEHIAGHPLAPTHPLVRATRWSVCEAGLLQDIARGRGIRRTEKTPLDVHVLGDVALPLPFDQVLSWEQAQPTPIELLAARGARLDCQPETKGYWTTAAAWLPDLFKDAQAAKDWARSEENRSRWDLSGNIDLPDVLHREQWLRLSARPLGSRYSIPVLVDPARREALGAVVELADRKPENRRKQAPGPKFAAVAGFLLDHGIVPLDPDAAAPLVAQMLPRAFPSVQDAEEWLDAIPPEDRGFDVPEAALARDWRPETVYFDQGDDLIEIPVLIAADARDALARRLWLARPEPEPDLEIEEAAGYLAETLGNLDRKLSAVVIPAGVAATAWSAAPVF